MPVPFRRVWRIIRRSFTILVIVLLILAGLFSTSPVQTWTAKQVVNQITSKTSLDLDLERLKYSFPNKVSLQGLVLRDAYSDTVMSIGFLSTRLVDFNRNFSKLTFGKSSIDSLDIYLVTHEGDSLNGFQYFLKAVKRKKKKEKKPFYMDLARAHIEHLRFKLIKEGCDDCFSIDWPKAELNAKNLVIQRDSIGANLQHVSFEDPARLSLKHLEGDAHYARHSSGISDWLMLTDSSRFEGNVKLSYDAPDAFLNFVEEVRIDLKLEDSRASLHDGNVFLTSIPDLPPFDMDLEAHGRLDSLNINYLKFNHNKASEGELKGRLWAMSENYGPEMEFDIKDLSSSRKELKKILSAFDKADLMPSQLDSLQNFNLKGIYSGNRQTVHFDGDLRSNLGKLETDATLVIDSLNSENISLAGEFRMQDLKLGHVLSKPDFGLVTGGALANLQFSGKNFPKGRLQGAVSKIQWKQHTFSGINVDGVVEQENFTGSLNVQDSLIKLKFFGSADLSIDKGSYDFTAEIGKLDLAGLGWVSDTIGTMTAKLGLKAKGVFPENIIGELNMYEATYEDPMNFYFFQDMSLASNWEDSIHKLSLNSDFLIAEAVGKFYLPQLPGFVSNYFNRYSGGDSTYAKEIESIDLSVDLLRPRILNELIMPELDVAPGAHLSANYTAEEDVLHLNFASSRIGYKNLYFSDISIKDRDTINGIDLKIADLRIRQREFSNLQLQTSKEADSLRIDFKGILLDTVNAGFDISVNLLRDQDTTYIFDFLPTSINYGEYEVKNEGIGEVWYTPSGVEVKGVVLEGDNNEGRLFVNGHISKSPYQILRLNFDGFEAGIFNPFLRIYNTEIFAKMNGQVIMSELLDDPKYAIGIQTEETMVNNFDLGDLDLKSDWSIYTGVVELDGSIDKKELKKLDITGNFYPDSLYADIQMNFNRFDLNVLQPYVSSIVTNLNGKGSGELTVCGKLGDISVNGELELPGTSFTVPVLNTSYNFDGPPQVSITDDKIVMDPIFIRPSITDDLKLKDDIKLEDVAKGRGEVSLTVKHNKFKDFDLDLQVDADKLLALNTTSKNSSYYYGIAFGTGLIKISGPPDNLRLDVDAKADEGTVFSIPMGGPKEVVGSSFITFKEPDRLILSRLGNEQVRQESKGNPLEIHFDLEVTPVAELEIIIDEQTGDLLKGRGRGQIQLHIDREGDVQILGGVTVDKGYYMFTLTGIVNRRFDLVQGGTLRWNGSPYESQIDIKALYNTRVSLGPILEEYQGVRTDLDLYLILREDLMNPTIDFEIKTPQATSDAQAKLENYFADKDRLNRQAFSILSMNTLLAEDGTNSGGGVFSETNITNNTYQVLTSQVSNWLNSGVNFIDINVNYVGSEDPGVTNDEFEVGLSKKLMNDRLTINGEFDVPVGADQTQQQQALVGDVELVYDITPDGRFKARVFNETNDQLNGQITTMYTQGLGIFYTTDFNSFSELTQKIFGIKPDEDEGKKAE